MGKYLIIFMLSLAVCSIGFFYFLKRYEHFLIEQAQTNLHTVAEERKNAINTYFSKHEQQLIKLAQAPYVRQALEHFQESEFNKFLEQNALAAFYSQIFLITTQGEVLFTRQKSSELGTNVRTGIYSTTALGQSYARVIMILTPDITATSYYTVTQRPALFISVPIFKETKLIGILSVQLSFADIFSIVENYKDLGKTGEIILAEQQENETLFVSNIRHSLYGNSLEEDTAENKEFLKIGRTVQGQRIPAFNDRSTLLAKAARGMQDSAISLDYRGKKALTLSRYIPKPHWGMIVKMDLDEILAPAYYARFIAYGLIVITLLLFLFLSMNLLLQSFSFFGIFKPLISTTAIGISILFGYIAYSYLVTTKTIIQLSVQEAKTTLNHTAEMLEHNIKEVTYVASALVDDLSKNRLDKYDIPIRIQRDLNEHSTIAGIIVAYAPYTYDAKQKLYAPYSIRKAGIITTHQVNTLYDYTKTSPQNPAQTTWYMDALLGHPIWTNHYTDALQGTEQSVYSLPFYKNHTIAGVVAVIYKLESVRKITNAMTAGKTGYSFLTSFLGRFLEHPIEDYILQDKTIQTIAKETDNNLLELAFQKSRHTNQGIIKGNTKDSPEGTWIFYRKINGPQWILGTVLNKKDIVLPLKKLHNYQFWIVILGTLTTVCITLFILSFFAITAPLYSIASSIIIAGGLGTLWMLIERNSVLLEAHELIRDRLSLNKFIDELENSAQTHHKPMPFILETGIIIDSFTKVTPQSVAFIGQVWQKYKVPQHTTLARAIRFPQAIRATIKELYRQHFKDSEIVGWSVYCELSQSSLGTIFYPFDTKHVEIIIEHPDITKQIVLVPDLSSYSTLAPHTLPGISNQASLLGFTLKKSFFNYKTALRNTTFGLQRSDSTYPTFTFNVLANRGLLNALIIYILPLIVILISLFAVLWLLNYFYQGDESSPLFRAFSVYTALLFSLILIHRSLRTDLPASGILYVEYLFFFTYVTILLLELYTVFTPQQNKYKQGNNILIWVKLLYWPIQLSVWLITTTLMFYRY